MEVSVRPGSRCGCRRAGSRVLPQLGPGRQELRDALMRRCSRALALVTCFRSTRSETQDRVLLCHLRQRKPVPKLRDPQFPLRGSTVTLRRSENVFPVTAAQLNAPTVLNYLLDCESAPRYTCSMFRSKHDTMRASLVDVAGDQAPARAHLLVCPVEPDVSERSGDHLGQWPHSIWELHPSLGVKDREQVTRAVSSLAAWVVEITMGLFVPRCHCVGGGAYCSMIIVGGSKTAG